MALTKMPSAEFHGGTGTELAFRKMQNFSLKHDLFIVCRPRDESVDEEKKEKRNQLFPWVALALTHMCKPRIRDMSGCAH
jgi:hypothetical protein